jgi:hypothetical protein
MGTPENVGVTSLAFSAVNQRLLAVGCYDGRICLFDVGAAMAQPGVSAPMALSQRMGPGVHSEPVWQLQWIPSKEVSGGQVLCSVSTDGLVTEWSIKGSKLTPRPLMTLKRLQNFGGLGEGGAAAGSDKAAAAAAPPLPAAKKGGAPLAAQAAKAAAAPPSSSSETSLGAPGTEGLLSRNAAGLTLEFVFDPPPPPWMAACCL